MEHQGVDPPAGDAEFARAYEERCQGQGFWFSRARTSRRLGSVAERNVKEEIAGRNRKRNP